MMQAILSHEIEIMFISRLKAKNAHRIGVACNERERAPHLVLIIALVLFARQSKFKNS